MARSRSCFRGPVYRVALAGREVNRWQFGCVRLWELEAAVALEKGSPGLVALVPLMRGGSDWELLARAVKHVEAVLPSEGRKQGLSEGPAGGPERG
jgi:hypothetical protein